MPQEEGCRGWPLKALTGEEDGAGDGVVGAVRVLKYLEQLKIGPAHPPRAHEQVVVEAAVGPFRRPHAELGYKDLLLATLLKDRSNRNVFHVQNVGAQAHDIRVLLAAPLLGGHEHRVAAADGNELNQNVGRAKREAAGAAGKLGRWAAVVGGARGESRDRLASAAYASRIASRSSVWLYEASGQRPTTATNAVVDRPARVMGLTTCL
jgi:hypothetical protein